MANYLIKPSFDPEVEHHTTRSFWVNVRDTHDKNLFGTLSARVMPLRQGVFVLVYASTNPPKLVSGEGLALFFGPVQVGTAIVMSVSTAAQTAFAKRTSNLPIQLAIPAE